MRMRVSFDVGVPAEAVYRFYADPARWALGDHAPGYTIEPAGPIEMGSVLTLRGPGLKEPWHAEVIDLQPSTRLTWRVRPGRHPDRVAVMTYDIEPIGTASAVTETTETHMGRFLELGMLMSRPVWEFAVRRGKRKQAAVIAQQYRAGRLT